MSYNFGSAIKTMLNSVGNNTVTTAATASPTVGLTTVIGNAQSMVSSSIGHIPAGQTTTFVNPSFGQLNTGSSYQIHFDFCDQGDSTLLGLPALRAKDDWRQRTQADIQKFSGSEFDFEGDLFGTNFVMKNVIMEFHFHTWRLTHEHVTDYGMMSNMSDREEKLWFSSAKSRDDFRVWFANYETLFPDKFLARWRVSPLIVGRKTLTFAERKLASNDDELCVMWAWLLTNCAARVYFLPGFLAFENENDAVGFRLRWS